MTPSIALSAEQRHFLASMLNQKYKSAIGDRYFVVESISGVGVLTITVTLKNDQGSFVYPVEARIDLANQDLSEIEGRDLLLDFIESYFAEFLNDGQETYLPIDWSTYDVDGFEFQMRGQILNQHLESLADALIEGKDISQITSPYKKHFH
jgi:hypothetical protein